jgi:protocatechuate 3,4-dioxygenase beta subunit
MNRKTKALVVFSALLIVALGFAAAQFQRNARAVVSTGALKGLPDVAYDAQAGLYLLVWQERSGSGDDRDIRARLLNPDGSPAGAIIALASSAEDDRFPKVAASGSSSWTVVWTTGRSVEACLVDATGKADGFRTLTAASSRPVDRPDIGALPDGAFLAVWEEYGSTGLTAIKGRTLRGAEADGEEFLLAASSDHDLRRPSVDRSGDLAFVAWEKPVDARRVDIEGRTVPAGAAGSDDLGDIVAVASDGARNALPSVTSVPGAILVVWERSEGRRDSDLAYASLSGGEIRASGKITDTADVRETRPFAAAAGIAGRVLITYQSAPADRPLAREIAARTFGWGESSASDEIVVDAARLGGGNPASVLAAGANGRGLIVWDVKEGEGTDLYAKEWLAPELADDGLPLALDGPIVPLADITISGQVTFNGLPQADVLMSGFPGEVRTDAAGAYAAAVPAPWSGTITPAQPGFAFTPASRTYIDVAVDTPGENYTTAYVGGVDDAYEENDSRDVAYELPIGTTHDIILRDPDWFKFTVPAADAGKDLKVRVWGTGFPDTTTRRDLDFYILDPSGRLVSVSLSGAPDETAYIADAVEGTYYVGQDYIGLIGTVYSISVELSDAYGLGYVTGYVLDDFGAPVEGATVELYSLIFDFNVSRPLTFTDETGFYRIAWLPGDYTVRFNISDFGNDGLDWTPDANYLGEMYNWGEIVSLSPGVTVADIDTTLIPGGVVSGTITDGSGAPMTNASATVYANDFTSPGTDATDAAGFYTIDRLRAGNFAVRQRNPGGGALINEWYDDRAGFAAADPVGVEAGVTTPGVDARLEERAWGTIQGHVTDGGGNPVNNMVVAIADPMGLTLWSTRTDSSGFYAITRVPTGSWKVYFNTTSLAIPHLVPMYYPGTRLLSDAALVTVQAGEITEGIDITLPFAGSISGQVLDTRGSLTVIAFDTAAATFSRGVSPALPLTGPCPYTLNYLLPGTYKVMARPNQQGDRIPHWHPDAASYAAAGTVTVTAGATTTGVDITLASGGGSITGRVVDADGFPVAGVAVIVQDATRQQGYSSFPSNADGYYTVRQIPPGSAKVFFNADANWLNYVSEYYNNRVDFATANSVTVTEGETTTLSDAALAYRTALGVGTASLPSGEVALAYSQQLAAVGGRPFYRWEIISGLLPDGLSMGSNGLIAGTPTTPGTYDFTVQLTDSTWPAPTSEIRFLSITVGAYTGEGYTISGTVTEGGSPLAGVLLDELPGAPVTSSTGTYVAVVEAGFWDTVTPVLAGYAFDPPFRNYTAVTENLSGQDYSGSPGYRLSGTITVGGAPLSGVRITGLPTELRTDDQGMYSVMLPIGWGGTVIPELSGFTFSPPYMNYAQLLADTTGQDYTATFVGGQDDLYEDNDSFAAAAEISMGMVIPDLVLLDEDWFKFYVPAEDAGKVLGIRIFATSFPNGVAVPDTLNNKDLDFGLMDATGKLLSHAISGAVDEVVFLPDIQPGWYTIAHTYMQNPGMVYSIYVTASDELPVGTISGQVVVDGEQPVDGVTVELYKIPFDWNDSHPLAVTDADGNYKLAAFSGNYKIKVNVQDYSQNPNDGYPDTWLPVRNILSGTFNHDATVVVSPDVPVTGADVSLEWAGAISGRVTDGDGNPLEQARVNAYLDGGIQASSAYTDAAGNYTLRRLRPAVFALQFRPPTGSPLAREFYDDRTTLAASLPVVAVAEATTAGIDAEFEMGGQITGRVTNGTGDPVPGVQVVAPDAAGMAMQATTTLSDGTYILGSLREGSYSLVFNVSTCVAGNYVSRGYGSGEPVLVADGQTTSGIDVVVSDAGAISGRLDGPDGHGLMNGSVGAFRDQAGDFFAATIDYQGNYTIRNLPPGDYRVRFAYTYGTITNYPPKWYPDAADGASAALIPVIAGETATGINGTLVDDGGSISGRVTNLYGGGMADVLVQTEDGSFGPQATSRDVTDADGYYLIPNIPTGSAKVRFRTGYTTFGEEYYNDKPDYGTADAVPIVQSTDFPDVDAALSVRPSLTMVTSTLPPGELGAAYEQSLEASGGFRFYYWTLAGGALPPGLTVNSRGEITGTPTSQGTFDFMISVMDSGYPQHTVTSGLSITIGEYTGVGYTISGTVTADGSPLPEVTMSGLSGEPVTNASGGYVAVVPSGWTGTVSPGQPGYAFTPATMTYENVSADHSGQDYTAVPGNLISGTVTLDGAGLSGVTMTGLPGEPWTDAAGAYAATVPAGWSGTVTPVLGGYTFSPASRAYEAIAADATAQDFAATYAGGADDGFEDNDSLETAAVLPLGTTTGLIAHDEEWFKFYVPAREAGKDLRVRIWGTAYPNTTDRRDLDFYILDDRPLALSLNLSGGADETAYLCDVAEGWYTIGPTYFSIDGMVYAVSIDTNEDFGLGYVEGTVRDDEGAPIAGVAVELYGEPFNWDLSRPLIYTDDAGHYRIGYTPGPYTVQFNITNNQDEFPYIPDVNYLPEVYNNGQVLYLEPGVDQFGIDGQLTQGGVITGRITDALGEPLAQAMAYAYGGDTVRMAYDYTDADGNYVLDRLRAGNYAVRMRAPGGWPAATEWYQDAASFSAAQPIAVAPGGTAEHIDASLGVPGSISGRVTNGSGDPIEGVQVTAYDPAGIALQASATDAAGNYSVGRLPSGSFKLQFNAANVIAGNYASEYYPDQRLIADAGLVAVIADQVTAGIDAVLANGGTITGRVTSGGNALAGLPVHAIDADSDFFLSITTGMDGSYAIRNVPADTYRVRFRPGTGDLAVEWWNDQADFTSAGAVTVADGATVAGIDADLSEATGAVSGRVTDGFGAGIPGVTVIAQDMARIAAYNSVLTDADGYYVIGRLPTCQTKIWFNTDGAYLNYANEYYNDKADHGAADAVTVTAGEATTNIDAVLAARPALTITTDALPAGQLGVAYNATLAGSGGRMLYRFDVFSGDLPHGLAMNGRGEITGLPTLAGTYAFTVRLTDSTAPQQITTKELSITIGVYTGSGHTISGRIMSGGLPMQGVIVYGLPGPPTSNMWGEYVTVAPDEWSGTAAPAFTGYVFTPATRTYVDVTESLAGQDYEAFVARAISGTVTLNSAGLPGVVMSGLPGNPVTGPGGAYNGVVPDGWSGTVTPTLTGYTFTPATRTYTAVAADAAGQDYAASDFILKEDFVGTWDGQGVYYRNSDTGAWVRLASPATMIATGDIDGDGIDDLLGLWPTQGGIWVRYSQSGAWSRLSSTAVHIGAGDMNGDGRTDLLGTWDGQGVYYRNSLNGAWVRLASPATLITAGDIDDDGTDDLIGIWPTQGGVWVRYSASGAWARLSSTARDIAAGDANGDGRDDLIATWDGQGVYYRDSASGAWIMMASVATQVTCGDLDADGKADLLGIWPTQGGVWVKYSHNNSWARLSSTAIDLAAGIMRAQAQGVMATDGSTELVAPTGGSAPGPEGAVEPTDLADEGPGGRGFLPREESGSGQGPAITAGKRAWAPGPGERGFKFRQEKNLTPGPDKPKKTEKRKN